jgi:hypothetical protein
MEKIVPKFLITTGMTRGSYTAIEEDGVEKQIVGLDLVLGIVTADTADEAVETLFSIHLKNSTIPAYMQRKVITHLITDSSFIEVTKALAKIKQNDDKDKVKAQAFENKKCQWCGDVLPSNGAAQFSHLRKHLLRMLVKNILDKEKVNSVRSLKLEPDLLRLLEKAKGDGVFK